MAAPARSINFAQAMDLYRLQDPTELGLVLVSSDMGGGERDCVMTQLFSHYLNRNHSMILLCVSQDSFHHSTVALKLGTSFKMYSEGELFRLKLMNGLQDVREQLYADQIYEENFLTFLTDVDKEFPLYPLYKKIQSNILDLKKRNSNSKVIICIDDLSLLVTLGIQWSDLVTFLKQCQRIQLNDNTWEDICIIVGVDSVEPFEDEEKFFLMTNLAHLSTYWIRILAFKTGLDLNVHGEISICQKNKTTFQQDKKHYHFRLEERGMKLFPQGTALALI